MNEGDCSSFQQFEKEKADIAQNIRTDFNIPVAPEPLAFNLEYEQAKANMIEEQKKDNKDYSSQQFNQDIQERYKLKVMPDTLVNETRKLLTFLFSTKFEYQYNVPKLDNADEINFTLNIKPKKGTNGSINVINKKITVPMKGGLKADFSTGLYYSTIRNEKYALRNLYDNNDSLIGKDIVIEDAGKTGGVTALMHVYPRLSNVIQPSLTFGVGTSLDLNYSLLFGGSIMFGRESRFALSGGFNFSNVKVLSAKYPGNGHFERLKPDVVTVDTYNRFKRGGFLSFTYSLGLSKKTQEATATAPSKTEDKKPEEEKPKDETKEETKK